MSTSQATRAEQAVILLTPQQAGNDPSLPVHTYFGGAIELLQDLPDGPPRLVIGWAASDEAMDHFVERLGVSFAELDLVRSGFLLELINQFPKAQGLAVTRRNAQSECKALEAPFETLMDLSARLALPIRHLPGCSYVRLPTAPDGAIVYHIERR